MRRKKMGTKEAAKKKHPGERSIEEWEEISKKWVESGLSQRSYAYRNEIPMATFQKWMWRLRDMGKLGMPQKRGSLFKGSKCSSTSGFIPISIKGSVSKASTKAEPYCIVTFSGENRVVIETESGVRGLRDLISALISVQ